MAAADAAIARSMPSKGTGKPEEYHYFEEIQQILEEIRQEDGCLSLKDLAVNGRHLMELGIQGREVGLWLQRLLEAVLDEELPNHRESLLEFVKNSITKE